MPSNNSKYSEEFRNQTAEFIIENNRSATSVAEELGIDVVDEEQMFRLEKFRSF